MSGIEIPSADIEWLVSSGAASFLCSAKKDIADGDHLVNVIKRLRKNLSTDRARLIVQQVQLRDRAKAKFRNASQMFFTDKGLQQATGENISIYKARKFQSSSRVADLCCGIGGDTRQLAEVMNHSDVLPIGVDFDFVSSVFADANCRAANVRCKIECCSVEDAILPDGCWIHIDPDRRPHDQRTTRLEFFEPGIEELKTLEEKYRNVAIKLAPATKLPDQFRNRCQREWIGDRHETKQQVLWFGELADQASNSLATAVNDDGSVFGQYVPNEKESNSSSLIRAGVASHLGEYIYDLHSSVRAAKLVDNFASEFELCRLARDIPYLTGQKVQHPMVSRFRIVETCSLDRKKIEAMIRAHEVGTLEIKRRGVEQSIQDYFSKRRVSSKKLMTLFLTKTNRTGLAILAMRDSNS